MGLFSKIKEGLFKTRGSVGQKMDQLVENSRALDDDFYDELSDILVMADVGVTTATGAVDELRGRVTAEKITDAAKAKEIFKEILAARMRDKPMVLESPSVIFIIGVNGVGKTTSIGKLASRLKTVGRRVLIVAGDTFRAAAAEQLTVWADRADVPIVRRAEGADPASVVFDGIQTARARHADVLLVDTAGRVLGQHRGIVHYTIGQRRGLGDHLPGKMYVCGIRPADNAVVLGDGAALCRREAEAADFHWISGRPPGRPLRCRVKIRYRQPEQWAEVIPLGADRVRIRFDEAQRAVTPGQAAVLYDGDVVLGGGELAPW